MWRRALLVVPLLLAAGSALAIDYRSVKVPAAILYDAPSQKGKKLYLIKAQTPVEVVVRLEGWFKVRDAEGTLAWIEPGQLAEKRTLIVIAPTADVLQADKAEAAVIRQLEKWMVVDFVEAASPGWAKIRLRDGNTGFVHANQIWGL